MVTRRWLWLGVAPVFLAVLAVLGSLAMAGDRSADSADHFATKGEVFSAAIANGVAESVNPGVVRLEGAEALCTGSLIGPRWVLTAAHCELEVGALVRTGSIFVNGGSTARVLEWIPRGAWSGNVVQGDDIALIRLDAELPGPYLAYADAAAEPSLDGQGTAQVFGWGRTSATGAVSERLLSVEVGLTTSEECLELDDRVSVDRQLCGVGLASTGLGAPCYGDSGGPWLARDVVIGVESYGSPCDGQLDVATRVAAYAGWIRSVTGIEAAGRISEPAESPGGYWLVDRVGTVYSFGQAPYLGSVDYAGYPNCSLSVDYCDEVVDLEPTPAGDGYWVLDSTGFVWSFGAAPGLPNAFSTDDTLVAPAVSLTSTSGGDGYWLVTADGRVEAFGSAVSHGDLAGVALNQPVISSTIAPDGEGYWMLAADGGVFTFGDAPFYGSTGGMELNAPVVGMATTPSGGGYWLVAADGGVFAFGDAPFYGSLGGIELNAPVVGMVPSAGGEGYFMVAADGGVFAFGDAAFVGSLGSSSPPVPVVSLGVLAP